MCTIIRFPAPGPRPRRYPVFFVPRPARVHAFETGDYAVLRSRLGRVNNEMLWKIQQRMGRGPFLVHEEIERGQMTISNYDGLMDTVPSLFLLPPDTPDENEDNL